MSATSKNSARTSSRSHSRRSSLLFRRCSRPRRSPSSYPTSLFRSERISNHLCWPLLNSFQETSPATSHTQVSTTEPTFPTFKLADSHEKLVTVAQVNAASETTTTTLLTSPPTTTEPSLQEDEFEEEGGVLHSVKTSDSQDKSIGQQTPTPKVGISFHYEKQLNWWSGSKTTW